MKKLFLIVLPIVLVGSLVFSGCAAPKEEAKEIIIGHLGLLSGSGAVAGRPILDGARLAVDEINAAGGVLGARLVLVSRDDGGRPEESVRLARELILKDGAQFIQGPFTDACNMAVSQVGKELKTIIFPYVAKTQRLLSPEYFHPYIFQPSSNTLYEGGYAAMIVAKNPEWKSVFVIGPDYEYGRMQCGSFMSKLTELRPDVEFEQAWPALFATDFTPYVTRMVQTKPDVVFIAQWGGDFITLLKQMAAFHVFDVVHFVVTVGENGSPEAAIPLGTDYPEGVFANAMDVFYWPDTPEHRAYEKALADISGEPYPFGNAIQGYIGIKLLAAAIEKAGTTDSLAVVKALEGLTIDTPLGPMLMGKDHQLRRQTIWGYTKRVPEYPFVILDRIELVPYESVVPD